MGGVGIWAFDEPPSSLRNCTEETAIVKLKLAGIVLKQTQNAKETKVTRRRIEVSRFYFLTPFPYFELFYTIVKFSYRTLYLCCYLTECHILKCSRPPRSVGDLWYKWRPADVSGAQG